jgi:hypothetical protein
MIGCWLLVMLAVGLLFFLTRPPQDVLQRAGAPRGLTVPLLEEAPSEAVGQAVVEPPIEEAEADLFDQLSVPEDEQFTELEADEPTEPDAGLAANEAVQRLEAAQAATEEQERRLIEWLGRAWPLLLVCVLALVAANVWLTGGQIGYLAKRVMTQQAAVAEFWRVGARAFWPVLGAVLLSFVIVVGLGVLMVLLGAGLAVLVSALPDLAAALVGLILGLLALAVLVWLGVRLVFWLIAVVTEPVGPIRGLSASFRATKGHWWRSFGLMALLGVISLATMLIFGLADRLGAFIGGAGGAVLSGLSNILGWVAGVFLGFVATAALIRFYADTKSAPTPDTASPVA